MSKIPKVKKFENIFTSSAVELANEELRIWKDNYFYVCSIIKGKNSLTEMTNVLQKEVIKGDRNDISEDGRPVYLRLQTGLFYYTMVCDDEKVSDVSYLLSNTKDDEHNSAFKLGSFWMFP